MFDCRVPFAHPAISFSLPDGYLKGPWPMIFYRYPDTIPMTHENETGKLVVVVGSEIAPVMLNHPALAVFVNLMAGDMV